MLKDPDVIRVLLARLIAARCPVFVFVEGDGERYGTMLLELDAEANALIADELTPRHGNANVRRGAKLRVAARLEGVEMRFSTSVRAIDADADVSAYMLDVPAELDHREQRAVHRTRAFAVAAELRDPDGPPVEGRVLDVSIAENISLPDLLSYTKSFLMQPRPEAENAERQRKQLNIKARSIHSLAGTLSGGNQQKVVLAKWLSMKPKVIIFDEPTRGVDVGAKQEIYELMRALSDHGVAILMISSDMEEVIGVSDRMAVMHEGRISGFLQRDRFSEDNVLKLAVGQTLQ